MLLNEETDTTEKNDRCSQKEDIFLMGRAVDIGAVST